MSRCIEQMVLPQDSVWTKPHHERLFRRWRQIARRRVFVHEDHGHWDVHYESLKQNPPDHRALEDTPASRQLLALRLDDRPGTTSRDLQPLLEIAQAQAQSRRAPLQGAVPKATVLGGLQPPPLRPVRDPVSRAYVEAEQDGWDTPRDLRAAPELSEGWTYEVSLHPGQKSKAKMQERECRRWPEHHAEGPPAKAGRDIIMLPIDPPGQPVPQTPPLAAQLRSPTPDSRG